MASDVLVDTCPPQSPRAGSPALSSSDNDAANTSDARVFFGPIHDAEKKFGRLSSAEQHATPLRRSQRLSVVRAAPDPASSSDGEAEEDGEEADASADADAPSGSRPATPTMQDETVDAEPSSALACKVMRAWDNPSPPPSPPATSPTPEAAQDPEDVTALILDGIETVQELIPTISAQGLNSSQIPVPISVSGGSPALASDTQDDLISFDSFTMPAPTPAMTVIAPTAPSTPTRVRDAPTTVDELLAISPFPNRTNGSHLARNIDPPAASSPNALDQLSRETTPSVDEEAQVDISLSSGIFDPPSSPPPPSDSSANPFLDLVMSEPLVPELVHDEGFGMTTPLRRSSRPRRSVSPFVASPTKSRATRSPALLDPLQTPNLVGPARRKSVKGKLKALSAESEDYDSDSGRADQDNAHEMEAALPSVVLPATEPESEFAATDSSRPPEAASSTQLGTDASFATPRAGTHPNNNIDNAISHSPTTGLTNETQTGDTAEGAHATGETHTVRLTSLSPSSHDVLQRLLSAKEDFGTAADTAEEGAALFLDDPPASANTAHGAFPATPQRPPVAPPEVYNAPLTHTPQAPLRPATPLQASQSTPAATRTPARRVPVADAVAQGFVSPQKGGARFLLPSASLPDVAGTPLFRQRALDDPARTPAKRVLVAGASADAVTPSQLRAPARRQPSAEPTPLTATAAAVGGMRPGFSFARPAHAVQHQQPPAPSATRLPYPIIAPRPPATPSTATASSEAKLAETTAPAPSLPPPPPHAHVHAPSQSQSQASETQGQTHPHPHAQAQTPAKASALRQPTVRLQSKIPRAGKPYARPTPGPSSRVKGVAGTKGAASSSSSKPATASSVAGHKRTESQTSSGAATVGAPAPTPVPAVRPLRLRKVISNKPIVIDSDESDGPAAGPGPRTTASRAAAAARQATPPAVPPSTLKRKREVGAAGDGMYSSPGTRPVVLLRRVVSTKAHGQENANANVHAHKAPPTPTPVPRSTAAATASAKARASPARAARVSPAKQSQAHAGGTAVEKIQMRKVVGTKKSKVGARNAASPGPEAGQRHPEGGPAAGDGAASEHPPSSDDAPQAPSGPAAGSTTVSSSSPPQIAAETNGSVAATRSPSPGSQSAQAVAEQEAPDVQRPSTPSPPEPQPEPEPEPEPSAYGLRRTSRTRRSTGTSGDVFGPISSTSRRASSAHARRKPAILGPPDTSVFSGMSMLALKTLTNNNTLRNQRQVAELETEVVMKDGRRPDSPTTRVRTTLEQQREARVKEREERAARRAKRQAAREGAVLEEDAGGEGEDGGVGPGVGEDSMMTDGGVADESVGELLRHRQGPGDEEPYETPERPLKRGRFEDGMDIDGAAQDKRVKWDRGLQTTVYLDDTPPRLRKSAKEEVVAKKGCLAPSAKSLRLDNMGNALNADDPVPDIIVEHILVKKFVYEDDEIPEVEEPPEPVAKTTRSRSKKAKAS